MDQEKLKLLCHDIITDPSLEPKKNKAGEVIETYCNFAANRVCKSFGYNGLDGKNADQISDFLAQDSKWTKCSASEAQKMANQGTIVIACHAYPGHGHVAIVYPGGGLTFSGHWQCDCATVANVGHTNGIMGANQAFPVQTRTKPPQPMPPPEYYYLLNP